MKVEDFVKIIDSDFYCGVPDSQLKSLCDYLIHTYGMNPKHHIIAANEGNCVAIAAGYHLSTGKIPVVYMQNSGEGNAINPIASLIHEEVYAIPMIFIVGWRGEPNVHDEPQHRFQGKVTVKLLEDMGISTFVIDKETKEDELLKVISNYKEHSLSGKSIALIIKKGALSYEENVDYSNKNLVKREEIIEHILTIADNDPVISTTGKASRELFEIRESNNQGHEKDFLTVGSMGHSSSIALGVALNKPNSKVWCIDGDGAMLMHMGAMAVIGAYAPNNMVHIVINNSAHETVGGMPTVAGNMDLLKIAEGCGYQRYMSVDNLVELDKALKLAKSSGELFFIEVKCSMGSRSNLGRPTTSTLENKHAFMCFLECLE